MATSTQGMKLNQFDAWQIAQGLWVLLTAFLAWVGKRALTRLDSLEKEAVRKEDFDKAIADMKAERKSMHDQNKEILSRIEDKIDIAAQAAMIERLKNLEQRLERVHKYAEDTKHNYVDPYIREMGNLKTKLDLLENRNAR
jgi:hypothetical protein